MGVLADVGNVTLLALSIVLQASSKVLPAPESTLNNYPDQKSFYLAPDGVSEDYTAIIPLYV